MTALLLAPFRKALAWLAALAVLVGLGYLRGRDAGKAKAEQHAAEASTKRQKDIEDALDTVDGSPDGWRELLKARK